MTLNDNPRVDAEKRRKQLLKRRNWLIRYKYQGNVIEYENDVAVRMRINPYIKKGKATKLIDQVNKELRQIEKFLKHFK